ncbi:scarecrow-like protein 14 [Vigna angularis]|uniref:scarecrow-like protein 14 n=1 Tax=Phaseolus angularis TaxID=3914 RepID=UPI00080A663B|nr:scarecrow-like protein 14 [Vigna angularis]
MRYDMILWYNVVQYEQVMIREPEKHQGGDNGAVHKTQPVSPTTPAEIVQQTGRRLARYYDRFKVPFEFNAIAQKWETIRVEELKIKENELLVVNTMFRFQNLLDETVVLNSPRDAVLSLVRKANPTIFIHGTVNGSYNAPFFVTWFREALFH